MFANLKNHPFAIDASFDRSIVLTFSVEKERVQHLIPPCLQPDVYKDKWAFVAIAMVQTNDLRPAGFPKIFGNDFFFIGYRIFVRYINHAGKRLRGLYILQSETNSSTMQLLGDVFTRYHYKTTDIHQSDKSGKIQIKSYKSQFNVVLQTERPEVALPPNSPFDTWSDARKFAGPLPFTFSYLPKTSQVLIVEGVRESWIPKPIEVEEYDFKFLHSIGLADAPLANAFMIEKIDYHWRKGKLESWNPG